MRGWKHELAWSPEALRTAVKRLAYPEREGLAYLRQVGSYLSLDELALGLDDELGRVRTELPLDHPRYSDSTSS